MQDLLFIAAKYICSAPTGSIRPTLSYNWRSLNTLTLSSFAYGSLISWLSSGVLVYSYDGSNLYSPYGSTNNHLFF